MLLREVLDRLCSDLGKRFGSASVCREKAVFGSAKKLHDLDVELASIEDLDRLKRVPTSVETDILGAIVIEPVPRSVSSPKPVCIQLSKAVARVESLREGAARAINEITEKIARVGARARFDDVASGPVRIALEGFEGLRVSVYGLSVYLPKNPKLFLFAPIRDVALKHLKDLRGGSELAYAVTMFVEGVGRFANPLNMPASPDAVPAFMEVRGVDGTALWIGLTLSGHGIVAVPAYFVLVLRNRGRAIALASEGYVKAAKVTRDGVIEMRRQIPAPDDAEIERIGTEVSEVFRKFLAEWINASLAMQNIIALAAESMDLEI